MRLLLLTHRLPYAPNRGDRIRSYYLMRELARFADVSLFSLVHDADEARRVQDVPFAKHVATAAIPHARTRIQGALQLLTSKPLTHALLDAPGARPALEDIVRRRRPDVVVAYCSGMARFALEPPLADIPFVLDIVDVDSAKWSTLASKAHWPLKAIYAREAACLGTFEAAASRRARAVLAVSDREGDALRAIAPDANVHVIGNGVEFDAFRPIDPPTSAPVVVFCGVMNYGPNVEGILWFARNVWPIVRRSHPSAQFVIVGSEPTPAVRALAADPSVRVTGRVDAVPPHLWSAAVAVAPLLTARGLQNKVLEALAAGLPVVATESVYTGLPAAAHPGCIRADDPGAFAAAVVRLLDLPPADRRAFAERAPLSQLSWQAQLSPVQELVETAARGIEPQRR